MVLVRHRGTLADHARDGLPALDFGTLGGHSGEAGLVSSGFPKAKPTFVTRPEQVSCKEQTLTDRR
jgi:hypothetical protein